MSAEAFLRPRTEPEGFRGRFIFPNMNATASSSEETDDQTTESPSKVEDDVDNADDDKAAEKLFTHLAAPYETDRVKAASFAERKQIGSVKERALIYGEIKYEPFLEAVQKVKNKYGGLSRRGGERFVDLGSGSGKAVFAAALAHNFASCAGVEIMPSLHAISVKMYKDYERICASHVRPDGSFVRDTKVHLILGDATVFDLSDVDLVFMCSTVFDYNLMTRLAKCAGSMRVGSFMITLSKDLPCANWRVLERSNRNASWGGATMIIQKKIRDGHVPQSKFFRRREDESYKPTGSKTIFDAIRSLRGSRTKE